MGPVTDPILDALDPEQSQVAQSLDRPLVVLAGAGTGKTRAITHRVAWAVKQGRYDPAATLAVTFTTRAAGEMRSRLARLGVRRAQARTIHSAALRQCQYFWPQVFDSPFPAVMDNGFQAVARAASAVLGSSDVALVRDLETEISWAKSSNVAPEAYVELAGRADREVSGASAAQVASVLVHYEKIKSAQGVVDFHDILLCAASLLAEHPTVAEQIRDTYRHFVVDEYQDVSALQHRLVQLWVADRSDVCVVGDPNQAIHAFAGADASHLTGFAREFDADVVRLVRNYRSTPEILGAAGSVLRVRPHDPGALRATQPSGPAPELHGERSDAAEAEAVAEWLRERHGEGTPWRELAVLYRINAQSPPLEAALSEAGVPYTVRGAERFYERGEVRQAMLAIDRAAQQGPQAPATDVLAAVLHELSWTEQAPSGMGRQRERWESLAALREMVLSEAAAAGQWDAGQLAAWLRERASWQSAPVADAVTLSTMHAAKGLEWDGVAVVGVKEGLMPFVLAQEEPALGEERRLLHVALTRARRHLRISWPETSRSSRSRFLAGLATTSTVKRSAPDSRRRRSTTCRVCGGVLVSAEERKLRRHPDCEVSYDEALLEALRAWRREVAETAKVPAYVVFTDATLQAIAESRPGTERELLRLPGIGRVKVDRYGADCLGVVARHTT